MPRAAPTEPQLETERLDWRAWVPPEGIAAALEDAAPMMTKQELLAALHDAGMDVSARDLSFWQGRGILPYPSKQRRGSSTVALYPGWYPRLIRALRRHQSEGRSLEQIGPILRVLVEQTYSTVSPQRQRHIERTEARRSAYRLIDEINLRTRKLAAALQELDGRHVTAAELRLIYDDEVPRSIPLALDDGSV